MKVMITGAGGFLGSRLLSFYRDKYEVWGVGHRELDFTDVSETMKAVKRFARMCSYTAERYRMWERVRKSRSVRFS